MKFKLAIISLILIFTNSFAHKIDSYHIMAENWPPYQLVSKGKLYGLSVEVLEEMLKRVDSKLTRKDFHPTDWSVGYEQTRLVKNRVLFSAAKTKIRENQFKWVGPTTTTMSK